MADEAAIGEDTPKKDRLANLAPPWQPGQSGNPAGRPKGARSKLSEAFFQALHDDFVKACAEDETLGMKAIEAMRLEKPNEYARMIAGLMAKELTGEGGGPLSLVIETGVDRDED